MAEPLPTTVSVETAGVLLGVSRTTAYQLAASGGLPVAVLRVGRKRRVPTALLAEVLGLDLDELAARIADPEVVQRRTAANRRVELLCPPAGSPPDTSHGGPSREQPIPPTTR